MHELPAVRSLVTAVVRAAGGRRVRAVDVVIREPSDVAEEAVRLYFELLGRQTPAEGATLRLRREPATCDACGHTFGAREAPPVACPRCGRPVYGGGAGGLWVESIEVVEEP